MFSFLNCLSISNPAVIQHLEQRLRAVESLQVPTTLWLDEKSASLVYLSGWKDGTGYISHVFHVACVRDVRGLRGLDIAIDAFLSHWV